MLAFFISNNGTIQYDGLSTLNYDKIFTQSISIMLKPVNFCVSDSCSVSYCYIDEIHLFGSPWKSIYKNIFTHIKHPTSDITSDPIVNSTFKQSKNNLIYQNHKVFLFKE